MNYQAHYNRLIETRKHREREEGKYHERHHIIPKSMGGLNTDDNLIYLTAREHFLAHWLLCRIHKNSRFARQASVAFHSICTFRNSANQKSSKIKISSRIYAEARESIRLNGMSSESRKKIGDSKRGKPSFSRGKTGIVSDSTKQKIMEKNKGRKLTSEQLKARTDIYKNKRWFHDDIRSYMLLKDDSKILQLQLKPGRI